MLHASIESYQDHFWPTAGNRILSLIFCKCLLEITVADCFSLCCSDSQITFLCSSGVGRSGTFICFDIILDKIKTERVVDVYGVIHKVREQHMKMVKNLVRLSRILITLSLHLYWGLYYRELLLSTL